VAREVVQVFVCLDEALLENVFGIFPVLRDPQSQPEDPAAV